MLLSLVSKRSLEVDSRDSYGFALRPQHAQRYREYLSIYTEEETERAEKWKIFLERQDISAEPCTSEEEFQDTLQVDGQEVGEESVSEEGSSIFDAKNGNHVSGNLSECGLGGTEVHHPGKNIPETVGELSKERESGQEAQVPEEHHLVEESLGRYSEPVKDEEQTEPDKKQECSVESISDDDHQLQSVEGPVDHVHLQQENATKNPVAEPDKCGSEHETGQEKTKANDGQEWAQLSEEHQNLEEESLPRYSETEKDEEQPEPESNKEFSAKSISDEDHQRQSIEAPVDHLYLQQENATEKPVAEPESCGLEHEKEQKETKTRKVQEWSNIRPCFASIEAMMCSRVKIRKQKKNRQSALVGDHPSSINQSLASIAESEQNSGENDHDSGNPMSTSDSIKEEIDDHSSVSPETFFPWYEELEVLVRLGVPRDLRGEVWQAFVGVKERRIEKYYHDLLAQITNSEESKEDACSSDVQRKWKKQIEKDIPRTFPGHPALNDDGRDSLRRILLAYACHNPSVGYCQAMNFFAGLLLLLMPEENAFWTLVGVIDDYFDGYYTEEMIESQVDQLVFEEVMRERFPKLVNHLDSLGVQVAWISGPWFLSIFVNILPWECVLRVWDVLLFEGNRVVLFRTAFALMELYGPAIVATRDAGDAITSLQTLAGSSFDSSQLVLTACMGYLSTTEARLEELRERHRPAVLEIVEERLQKGRVWKDKKGLASKLYSFKHEGSILDEQKSKTTNGEGPNENESRSPNGSILDGTDVNLELDSLPDLQEQAIWLKGELCRLLEEKRSAVLRAEELEIALMEMVKEDNRLELSGRIDQLEEEVKELQQMLSDKKEQETAMLQVLMKVEQEQRLTEDARVSAEQDAAAQRYAVHMLQEKNEKLTAQLAQMEKRLVTAETTLEATLQYESGQNKALSSPRFGRTQVPAQDSFKKKTGFLSFGLGWRDRNKAKPQDDTTSIAISEDKAPLEDKSPSEASVSRQGSKSYEDSNLSKESKSEDMLNPDTRR